MKALVTDNNLLLRRPSPPPPLPQQPPPPPLPSTLARERGSLALRAPLPLLAAVGVGEGGVSRSGGGDEIAVGEVLAGEPPQQV